MSIREKIDKLLKIPATVERHEHEIGVIQGEQLDVERRQEEIRRRIRSLDARTRVMRRDDEDPPDGD